MNYRVDKISVPVYLTVFAIALVWTGGAIAAPVAEAHWGISVHHDRSFDASLPSVSGFIELLIRSSYGRICHQIPDRCYWIAGHPMAVCARCFGIYAGYIGGLVLYPFVVRLSNTETPHRKWLILALAPCGIDFLGGFTGLFQNTHGSRAATGFIAGAACVFYTLPGLVQFASARLNRRKSPLGPDLKNQLPGD